MRCGSGMTLARTATLATAAVFQRAQLLRSSSGLPPNQDNQDAGSNEAEPETLDEAAAAQQAEDERTDAAADEPVAKVAKLATPN